MAGLLARIFGREDVAISDAGRVYRKLMRQARRAEFYGEGRVPDTYNGRIDFLTLHIAVVLKALSKHGEQGERLSQALYDVMRDDFEIALREEGMSDTGVKRRIKPIMRLFFTRVKTYVEALNSEMPATALGETFRTELLTDSEPGFLAHIVNYIESFSNICTPLSLGQMAQADFDFPVHSDGN